MLKTAMNDWTLKALQMETALMALEEVGLPAEMKALQDKAEEGMRDLLRGWRERMPEEEERQWEVAELTGGKPQDEELAEVVGHLREEGQEWTLYRAKSDRNELVETVVSEDRAWMAAGGEYYYGQWDPDAQVLEVGRDDEEDEPGTGLVLELSGELVYESDFDT